MAALLEQYRCSMSATSAAAALAAICRRSRPADERQADYIAAILPAPTMRFAHAPRGIKKGPSP
ncbi:MAG: hypothetical protein Q8L16_04800 [Hydrogenophaga sp.]|uniref:hypothetical protein n=1 Tax=Hydrogenophaga sp. TaxID=1904254 RepID=UPI0027236D49|nr:hypothetical protein [Hydrogenophaga sp.]MDO9029916.1 hypothetical protein [Hydrogenophaga sp.]MDP2020193.1 hypothetical protein [Hydrogenophaga sp.]